MKKESDLNTTPSSLSSFLQPYFSDTSSTPERISTTEPTHKPKSIPTEYFTSNVYEITKQRDIVRYLHKADFCPTKTTWLTAIKADYFTTWPGLSAKLVEKYLDPTPETLKGHMKQTRHNVRSTSKTKKNEELSQIVMTLQIGERQNLILFKIIKLENKIYTDQTGRFPTTSSLGNKYVLVLLDADTNSILIEPLKSRAQEELLGKQVKLHKCLTDRGYKPITQVLDNECPDRLIQFFIKNTHTFNSCRHTCIGQTMQNGRSLRLKSI